MPTTVSATATFSTPGNSSFTAPVAVTSVTETAIGAAGGGAGDQGASRPAPAARLRSLPGVSCPAVR